MFICRKSSVQPTTWSAGSVNWLVLVRLHLLDCGDSGCWWFKADINSATVECCLDCFFETSGSHGRCRTGLCGDDVWGWHGNLQANWLHSLWKDSLHATNETVSDINQRDETAMGLSTLAFIAVGQKAADVFRTKRARFNFIEPAHFQRVVVDGGGGEAGLITGHKRD